MAAGQTQQLMEVAYLDVLCWMQPEPHRRTVSARPSRFVLWDNSHAGPPRGAGVWQGFGPLCTWIGTLSSGMPIWLTAYNCANINTVRPTSHTRSFFALVRKLSEEHRGTELRKYLPSLFTHTKSSFRLSECKWTTGRPASYHQLIWTHTALRLCHKVQHKPDLLRWSLLRKTLGRVLQHGCTEAALDTNAEGRHRAQISLIVLSEGQYSEGPAEDM